MNRTFGEKIRDTRIDMDLSQKEVAAMIPMNQSNYSKIERGMQEPNVYQLKRISEILRISVDELLGINKSTFEEEKLRNFQKEFDELYHKYFG
ncbi:MAG: helix-turn-helix transcriptional regulator [Bacilli bacterium]|nr:helix-turn-helix transcriptional regulator [Bacilli bacterium]